MLVSYARLELPFLTSDFYRPRDIIMETDMTYLNGTRGAECYGWEEEEEEEEGGSKRVGGTPSIPTRESRVVKPPTLQLSDSSYRPTRQRP